MNVTPGKFIEKFETLQNRKSEWDDTWKDIATYIVPSLDKKVKNIIVNGTPIKAREQLASQLQSLLINPATSWFKINIAGFENLNADLSIQRWSQDVERILLMGFNYPGSNFYNQIREFFLALVAYGTAIFYIEETPSLPQLVFFRNVPLKECFLQDNAQGLVDRMYRKFTLSIPLAAEKFPKVKEYQELLAKNIDEDREFLHVVIPKKSKQTKVCKSYYIDLEKETIIQESEYPFFPFLVARWDKDNNKGAYGFAPAHYVLPDIRTLNKFKRTELELNEKNINPPLLVPKEGYQLPINTTPGSTNYYRNGVADPIRPLIGLENIIPAEKTPIECMDAIARAFYTDLFSLSKTTKEMTAAEVHARNEEQMRLLSPIVGRLEAEFLNPLILNMYWLYRKYNLLPVLEGEGKELSPEIRIEYVSPLVRAQQSSSYNGVEHMLSFVQNLGLGNINPSIYDNFDFDEIIRLFVELKGIPVSVMRSTKDVSLIRQQRQQQMQQIEMQQQPTEETSESAV